MAFHWDNEGPSSNKKLSFVAGTVLSNLRKRSIDSSSLDSEEELKASVVKAVREAGLEIQQPKNFLSKESSLCGTNIDSTAATIARHLKSNEVKYQWKKATNVVKLSNTLRENGKNGKNDPQDGLTPEDRALKVNKPAAAALLQQQRNNPQQHWFPLNVNRLECSIFSPKPENLNLCQCGLTKEEHQVVKTKSGSLIENLSNNELLPSRMMESLDAQQQQQLPSQQWKNENIFNLPNNAFGEIEFSGLNQTAKFVRLAEETNENIVQKILMEKWELNKPTLIISIFGGHFEKKRQLRMIFKKGLWKAAESAGCWIVTGGFNIGIMKLTGEAVRDYTDAYGGNHMIAIGVAGWGCVSRNELLVSSNYEGTYPAIYQSEEDNPCNDQHASNDEGEAPLDPNHTHFLLVDTGLAHRKGTESAFRAHFERLISHWKEEDETEVKVPMCGLLIGGDRFNIHQVYLALVNNQCPIVVVKGTSGAADVLAAAWDAQFVEDNKTEEEDEDKCLETKIRQSMVFFEEIHSDVHDFSEEVAMIKEILLRMSHLIEIFDMEENFDLDGKMISSLLSSAGTELASDQLNLEQLKICLTLNRPDIARDKIFLENKKWKKGDLNDYMFQALMQDRHEFVKLFLEQGFSLEEFLTIYMLEKLYTDQLKKLNSKVAIFHQLWEYHRSHRRSLGKRFKDFKDRKKNPETHRLNAASSKKVLLKEVGKVIRVLVGDFFHPLYLRKDFASKMLSHVAHSHANEHDKEKNCKATRQANFENATDIEAAQTGYPQAYYFSQKEEDSLLVSLPKSNHHGQHSSQSGDGTEISAAEAINSSADIFVSIKFIDDEGEDEVELNSNHGYVNPMIKHTPPNVASEKNSLQLTDAHFHHRLLAQLHPSEMQALLPTVASRKNKQISPMTATASRAARQRVQASVDFKSSSNQCESAAGGESVKMKTNKLRKTNFRRRSSLDFIDNVKRKKVSISTLNNVKGDAQQNIKWGAEEEARAKQVQLERPARELMIWSLLVGKLQMAELFWSMEKEPIAGALLSKMILAALEKRTDDFTDKEDYSNYAIFFERQAEGVLNECYREDERRAQNLINRELKYYGLSSCIVLAAEGESIKFMAHPCCQDFLTSTWMGKLSPKNSFSRFSLGILLGLTMPFLLPKFILYKLSEDDLKQQVPKLDREKQNVPKQHLHDKDRRSSSTSITIDMGTDSGNQYYPGQENIQRSDKLDFQQVIQRIRDFYMAPVVRFVYNTLAYLTFLFVFSFMLLFDLQIEIRPIEGLIIAWMITLLLEEIKQIWTATLSGISFSTYISDGWNKLDCIAVGLFSIGFVLRLISYLREQHSGFYQQLGVQPELYDEFFITGRIFFSFSLFAYYIRLMYIFSFHIALGPKLIMIGKMVMNDLVPFMVILVVFLFGYGVASHAIAYPRGYYTPPLSLMTSPNFTKPIPMTQSQILQHFLTRAYYQMFGDFGLDSIQGEDKSCKNDNECPNATSTWLVPIMLGIYVLLTNILMFNLLIAMFSRTYEIIENSSTYYWNYQRYQMIQEYVERSPLAPPLIIIWHIYELINYIKLRCAGVKLEELEDPFKRNYKHDPKKERELIKWEHMKAMDYLRNLAEPQGGRKKAGDSKSVILKTSAMSGGLNLGAAAAMQQQMADATGTLGLEMEKRFREIDNNLQRFNEVETRLTDLQNILTNFSTVMNNLVQQQLEISRSITDLPLCKCSPEAGGFTIDMIQAAVQDGLNKDIPIWFQDATEKVVHAALDQTPVKVSSDLVDLILQSRPEPIREPILNVQQATQQEPVLESPTQTDSDAESDCYDQFITPDVRDFGTGRVIERTCLEHRLWRVSPFNFEKYPGMRMNVPADRIPWEIEYRDYFAYDASDEVLIFAVDQCHDNPSISLRELAYNQYDTVHKIRRQSLIGRYRIDPSNGAPLNPMGRTGLKQKGLLPHWGPNHAIVAVITRWSRTPSGDVMRRNGHPILQVVSLFRNKQYCLPWYMTDHLPRCDFDQCVALILKTHIRRQLKSLVNKDKSSQEFKPVEKAKVEQAFKRTTVKLIFKGYLDDHLNADNAWIEAVVINFHENEDFKFNDGILKAFEESQVDESVKWMEVAYSTALRPSHCDILKNVAQTYNAYF